MTEAGARSLGGGVSPGDPLPSSTSATTPSSLNAVTLGYPFGSRWSLLRRGRRHGAVRTKPGLAWPCMLPGHCACCRCAHCFARMLGVDGSWTVFMEVVVSPLRPNGIPLDIDLVALGDRRLRDQAAEER